MAVPIPSWQRQILTTLAGKGGLSGVNPTDLAAIDVAESSGQGGGINSSGYGGFFGLGSATNYGTGYATTPAMLKTAGATGFRGQARIAAHEYASLLKQVGGTTLAAETAYQKGLGGLQSTGIGGEGVAIFKQYGLGGKTGTATPASSSSAGMPNATLTSALTVVNPFSHDFLNPVGAMATDLKEWAIRGVLIIFGAILIVMGLKALADQGKTELDRAPGESVTAAAEAEAQEHHDHGGADEAAELAAA